MIARLAPVALAAAVAGGAAGQAPEYETTRIADGVYQFRWQAHNAFVVVTPAGVVVVDPISRDASAQLTQEIRSIAPGAPLRAIVYSHDHADHATGATVLRDAFGATVPIVAHENAVPKIEATANADLPVPDVTFGRRADLRYGGTTVELHYLGPSHSDNMIVAYLPGARIAFAVDFVSNDRVGFRNLPDYHFPEFFEALHRLYAIPFETIVFGHGPPGDRASIERQLRYYADLRAAVQQAVEAGWSADRAAAEISLPAYAGWGQYEAWFPLNVRAIYAWLSGG